MFIPSGKKVEYLGQIEIHLSPKKLQGIVEMLAPKHLSQLRSFLGMVNHYGKFLPHLSDLSAPLNELLRKNKPWSWIVECQCCQSHEGTVDLS